MRSFFFFFSSSPLLAAALFVAAGCSAFPDVTYADDDSDVVTTDAPALVPGVDPEADAEASPTPGTSSGSATGSSSGGQEPHDASTPPTDPPDEPDASTPPGPTCTKNKCVGSACSVAGTCDRCKDACKGQTKKCCANVDPATPGGLALSCVADNARCPGEGP